jgi:hypothetical protein
MRRLLGLLIASFFMAAAAIAAEPKDSLLLSRAFTIRHALGSSLVSP